MSNEEVIVRDFQKTTQDFWVTREEYNRVNAILLCWEDDDLNVRPEIERLQELFETDFKFSAWIYSIPSESPSAQLQYQLATLVKRSSLERKSLTIVYYAGHADKAEVASPAGYSLWQA